MSGRRTPVPSRWTNYDTEIGALVDSHQWSATSLGPMEQWPDSLTLLLRTVLSAQQPMGVYWGPELVFLYNAGFIPILGEKHPAALGRSARDVWAEAWPVIHVDVESAMRGTGVLHERALVPIVRNAVLKDAWWNYSYSPAYDDAGEIAGTLLIATEVTGEVISQTLLERANREAENARRELQNIFTQAPLPMALLTGAEHRFILANPEYVKLVGREVVGKPLSSAFTDEEAGYYRPYLDRVYQTGEPVLVREAPLELDEVGSEPQHRYIDVGYYPHHDSHGRPAGVLAVIVDVTDQVGARKRSELAREVAEAANRAKDEFLATVSHELRTPLMSILGWAGMLRTNDDPRRLARGLELIERNAQAQAKLIEDILDVSRITSGKVRLSIDRVLVGPTVLVAIESIRPAATAKSISLELDLEHPDLAVVGDKDRIQQVVWNLLSNAVKFTPKHGRVTVRVYTESSQVHIVVSDNGKGISAAFLPHVFERFRQDDSSTTKREAGLGLGLAIVRQLVELHGGTVSAHSDGEGRGSTFQIVLPVRAVVDAATSDHEKENVITPAIGKPRPLEGIRLLVVDDQDDARELVATVLQDAGAKTIQACSAQDALAMLANAEVHAVITDIGMPDEDGYSLVQRLRAHGDPHRRALPALALTAFARAEDRERAIVAGFDDHVAKPIEPARLVTAVGQLFRHRTV